MVNAANEGCVAGFGVDEMLNRSAGHDMIAARKLLGGCLTGNAKITKSYNHANTKWVVHAVGPVHRINPLKRGFSATDPQAAAHYAELDKPLVSAYTGALDRATEVGARSIGFCLLSAGVFRGERALLDIIRIAVKTLHDACTDFDAFDEITLIAYTKEEQDALAVIANEMQK